MDEPQNYSNAIHHRKKYLKRPRQRRNYKKRDHVLCSNFPCIVTRVRPTPAAADAQPAAGMREDTLQQSLPSPLRGVAAHDGAAWGGG